MMASNAGIGVTIEGMRQLPAMRAEQAAAVPGTQTVYLPGEDYLSRSSIDAIDEALRKYREEQKQVVAQLCGRAQGGVAPEPAAAADENREETEQTEEAGYSMFRSFARTRESRATSAGVRDPGSPLSRG